MSARSDSNDRCVDCSFCSQPAVVKAVAIVDNCIEPLTPLCADCHVPLTELTLPGDTTAEDLMDIGGVYEPALMTTPADDVLYYGDEIVIDHGPGEQSRLTLDVKP
jgi:hypothetical protein